MLDFVNEKVVSVQRSTNGKTVLSALESTARYFDEFVTYSIADIQTTITSSYADDTQLHIHRNAEDLESSIPRLVSLIDNINCCVTLVRVGKPLEIKDG